MNSLESMNDEPKEIESEGSRIDMGALSKRLLTYWPLLVILLALGIAGAWTYIRYTPKLYSSTALLSLKRENPLENKTTSISISLGSSDNSMDKELLLLSSLQVFEEVVKRLHIYSEVMTKGSVMSNYLYGKTAPFTLKLDNPDSITNPGIYSVEIDWKTNSVILGEKMYPFNTTVNTPFGRGVFVKNQSLEGKSFDASLLLSVQNVSAKALSVRGGLKTLPTPKKPDLIQLDCFDLIPQRSIDILDTLLPVFDQFLLASKKKSLMNSQDFINERLRSVEDELSSVEQNISDFKSSNEIAGDALEQGEMAIAGQEANRSKLKEVDLQLSALDRAQEYLSARNRNSETLPTMVDIGNSAISSQLSQLITAEEELNRLRQVSGPENPKVLALERQISRLRPAIQEGANNYRNNLLSVRESFQKDQNMLIGKIRATPQKERQFIEITRQQSVKNQIYAYLLERREENILEQAALTGNSQFIRKPSSNGLASPIPYIVYLIAVLGSLIFFAIFAAIKEVMNNTYQSRKEVENTVDAPILGELFEQPGKKGDYGPVVMLDAIKPTIIGEQIREIRTNLIYLGMGGDNKVLLVTSSIPGEGKTTLSINIAANMSSTGKKVALLGFDLRKGKLGELCRVPTNPGISNYLVGQTSLAKICHRMDGYPNLDIFPEGLRPPNPAELILNERMEKLMQELKFHYDYIIIDSPPIGSVTDARLLAMHAFATLYVLRHQYTPRSYFPMIRELYQKKRLPNMALVLNGIKKYSFMGYTYGNGHANGYGYGYGYGYVDALTGAKTRDESFKPS